MKKKFSRKDVGRTVKYVPINSIDAVKPRIYSGLVVGIDMYDPEFAKVFNRRDKKLWDVCVSQLKG